MCLCVFVCVCVCVCVCSILFIIDDPILFEHSKLPIDLYQF